MTIGIDLVSIKRVNNLVVKFGNKATDRFLTKSEKKIAKKAQTIAGFYAVKEAVSKALGVGISKDFSFKDVKIKKDNNNRPYLRFKKSCKKKFGITKSSVSITHDGGFAIAVVAIKRKK